VSRISGHALAKLLVVSGISVVEHQNKVLTDINQTNTLMRVS